MPATIASPFIAPAAIASPSSAPDSASAASLLNRRTLSNDTTGDPARILRRFLCRTLAAPRRRAPTRRDPPAPARGRAAVSLAGAGRAARTPSPGSWWCTQNMWQRCAQKRGRCDSRTRSRAQKASSHPSPSPFGCRASHTPVPLYHHAHVRGVRHGRPVLFGGDPRTGGGDARPGPPTGYGRQKPARLQTRSTRSPSKLGPQPVARPAPASCNSLCTTTPYFLKYSAWDQIPPPWNRRAGTNPTSRRPSPRRTPRQRSRSMYACPAIIPSGHGSDVPPLVVARLTRRS